MKMSPEPVFKPILYDLKRPDEARAYRHLLESQRGLVRIDCIELMIAEWIKTCNPSTTYTAEALNEAVRERLDDLPAEQYGLWVYYPWLGKVVHLLPEEEFIALRTSRNQHKILHAEQQRLRTKKVGVVGLSVGQSVAVTMAQERCCGTIRLADFDVLELSNMNRIRSGVHEIGELKVVNTAREILEIDPFLQVEIFPEGLHRGNMEAFFSQGGMLDLVVDECDSLDVKLLLREHARQLRTPVLMDTSDRGMLDLEMFDREPERPILHGLVDDLRSDQLADLDTDGKIPHILKIVGVDTMSERMKASMMEVGQSIRTWPQLASSVVLGGGVTCDVARRVLLGANLRSGRYFIDPETLIPDIPEEKAKPVGQAETPFFPYRSYKSLATEVKNLPHAPGALELRRELLADIVGDAIQAPSGGNAQSWIWRWSGRRLSLFLDADRTVKLVDYDALGTISGLGAAAESLVLAAHARGLHVRVSAFPDMTTPECVAVFEFFEGDEPGCESHKFDDLYGLLYRRQCNRNKCARKLPPSALDSIRAFAALHTGFTWHLLTDPEKIGELGKITGATDRMRFTNETYHEELIREIRWTEQEAESTRDGIDLALVGLKPSELAAFRLAKQWPLMRMLADLKGGKAIEKMVYELLKPDEAIGLLTTDSITPAAYFNAGRFYQRMWLHCTRLGIDWHPIPATLYSFLRLGPGAGVGMPTPMQEEVGVLHKRFREVFGIGPEQHGVMLTRLVPTETLPLRSYRRPLHEVLFFD